MNPNAAPGQRLMLAFSGKDALSAEIAAALRQYRPAGITLFRSLNVDNPAQVRRLTAQLQQLAREIGLPPLLIATDQEGGQLMAVGSGVTQLPGNMALGAAGSEHLARQAGEVLGRELAAMGINVNYAPCLDVNINPRNPAVGTRSFGEDAQAVARLGAAMIAGIQSQRVAAVAKHFPGHGDTSSDSHHGLPAVPHSIERLRSVELPPFASGIRAGVKMVMSAHLALSALDGPDAPPATLSRKIITGLLREQLGFGGVTITDAMDMRAIRQGELLGEDALRALRAGIDLLLLTTSAEDHARVYRAVSRAFADNLLDPAERAASAARIAALQEWVVQPGELPDLNAAGCAEHGHVAEEIARRSVTLVRDEKHILPLRLRAGQKIAVVLPRPRDLTPADTSSYVIPGLSAALRQVHPLVDEFLLPFAPEESDIAALLEQVTGSDLIIVGTLNAYDQPGQQALVRRLLRTGLPVVVAALRLPYDLAAFPEAPAYICTYSILEPAMQALAQALFGQFPFQGKLPVTIPGMYGVGFGLHR